MCGVGGVGGVVVLFGLAEDDGGCRVEVGDYEVLEFSE